MKAIVCLMLAFILSTFKLSAQNIGLRGGYCFSDVKTINNAFGGGIYLNINGFSKRIELLFSFDYNKANKSLKSQGEFSSYKEYIFSISPLFDIIRKEKIKVRVGPSLSYNTIDVGESGLVLGFINQFDSKDIGLGLLFNTQFARIFNSDFNIDVFVTPDYLINAYYKSETSGIMSPYSNNLKLLNLGLGISYGL